MRLIEGDFARETTYADDPVAMAQHWQAEGARRLHVVDLDGARDGVRANADVIRRIVAALDIPVQVGGGVRSIGIARELLDDGVDRVVVGTVLLEAPDSAGDWVQALSGQRLIVAVDARGRRVATRGWQQQTDLDVVALCERLKSSGVQRVLYTDVAHDGRLDGPDIEGTAAIAAVVTVIGSGGVATTEHLRALERAGAEGAIIGTALYERKLTLKEALAC